VVKIQRNPLIAAHIQPMQTGRHGSSFPGHLANHKKAKIRPNSKAQRQRMRGSFLSIAFVIRPLSRDCLRQWSVVMFILFGVILQVYALIGW